MSNPRALDVTSAILLHAVTALISTAVPGCDIESSIACCQPLNFTLIPGFSAKRKRFNGHSTSDGTSLYMHHMHILRRSSSSRPPGGVPEQFATLREGDIYFLRGAQSGQCKIFG